MTKNYERKTGHKFGHLLPKTQRVFFINSRVFRARDGTMIANYRVPSDLSSLESTTDGYSVVLG